MTPLLVAGELVVGDALKARPGYDSLPSGVPERSSERYRDVLRDVHLLRGLWPPVQADGRTAMAQFDDRGDDHRGQRRALPGPYALPAHWRQTPDPADLELARLAPAIGLRRVQRLDVDVRGEMLEELRARARAQATERTDLVQRLLKLRETGGRERCSSSTPMRRVAHRRRRGTHLSRRLAVATGRAHDHRAHASMSERTPPFPTTP